MMRKAFVVAAAAIGAFVLSGSMALAQTPTSVTESGQTPAGHQTTAKKKSKRAAKKTAAKKRRAKKPATTTTPPK